MPFYHIVKKNVDLNCESRDLYCYIVQLCGNKQKSPPSFGKYNGIFLSYLFNKRPSFEWFRKMAFYSATNLLEREACIPHVVTDDRFAENRFNRPRQTRGPGAPSPLSGGAPPPLGRGSICRPPRAGCRPRAPRRAARTALD